MDTPLRVLSVEDSEDDALLLLRELRRGGLEPVFTRVDTPKAMAETLDKQPWDVVISDYAMPHFSGRDALALLKESGLDLPFIVVSGAIGEETAVEMMHAGAHDYIMKGNLARLVPAIERELREAEVRRKRKQAEEALRTSEAEYRGLFENVFDGVYRSMPEGRILTVNPALVSMLGYDSAEELSNASNVRDLYANPEERAYWVRILDDEGEIRNVELTLKCKDGQQVTVLENARSVRDEQGIVLYYEGTLTDITERKRAEEALQKAHDELEARVEERTAELRASEEYLRILFEYAPDAYYLSDLKGNFIDGNRAAEKMVGNDKDELIGKSLLSLNLLTLGQIPMAAAHLARNVMGHPTGPDEFTLTRRDGSQVPVEISTHPVKIKGQSLVLGLARDITKRKQAEEALQKAHDELEQRVEERTSELARANEQLERELIERKQAEEALRASERKYRGIVEQSQDGIALTNEEGIIIEWNRGQEQIVGLKGEEVLGLPMWDMLFQVLPEERRTQATLDELMALVKEGLKAGQGFWMNQVMEGEIQDSDGASRLTQQLVYPIETEQGFMLAAITRDVTERKQAEEEIRRYNERLVSMHEMDRAILTAQSPEEIAQAALSRIRKLVDCQRASVSLFDPESDTFSILAVDLNGETHLSKGKTLPRDAFRYDGATQQDAVNVVEDLSSRSDLTEVEQRLLEEGIRSYISVPLNAEGEILGVFNLGATRAGGCSQDDMEIASEVAAQLAIAIHQAQLYQRLQQTNVELEEAVAAKDVMISNVSHELRTPLTHIIGYSDLLSIGAMGGELPPEAQQSVAVIHKQATGLSNMVDTLITLQTLDIETFDLQNVDLYRLVENTQSIWHENLRKTDVTLEVQTVADLPAIRGDFGRLRQALDQLFDNAFKFMPDGGQISLRVERQEDEVQLSVSDTGIGISPEQLEQIFERFHQVDGTSTRKYGGMGLGLSLAEAIVELHGGRVWAESQGEGHGTALHIVLPIAPA